MYISPLSRLSPLGGGASEGGAAFSNAYSLLLDGVDEYVNIDAVATALSATTVGTFSFWVKHVSTAVASQMISFSDTDQATTLFVLMTGAGTVRTEVRIGGTTQFRVTTNATPFTNNVWTHVAITADGVNMPKMYFDAVEVAHTDNITTDVTKWISDLTGLDNGRIGCIDFSAAGNATFSNANFDEVLFINRALTSGEITTLYNGGTPKDETAIANGVSQFRFDGDIMTTATDAIGTNNGTFVNCEQADIELDVP